MDFQGFKLGRKSAGEPQVPEIFDDKPVGKREEVRRLGKIQQ
jgi:hypothetical protein